LNINQDENLKIAHISDTHISPFGWFVEESYDKMVEKINEIKPNLVIHSGDITQDGLLEEYRFAQEKLKQIEAELVVIPGNHDGRNLGNTLYKDFFGKRQTTKRIEDMGITVLDTTVPDINEGRLGRAGQEFLEKSLFLYFGIVKIVSLHHHLIPIPEAGRERNMIDDAGDVLKLITKNNVELVLMGHRHVPYTTKVENTIMSNAGTLSSRKTRGYHGHSFTLIDLSKKSVELKVIKLLEGKFTTEIVNKYQIA